MENTINYNHVDYSSYQLRLPLDLSLVIDKLDPMWSFLEIVNSINLRRFIRSHKGNQGYDPIMMMRVILFAYMNHVYSLRAIEEKCKTDIRFMYLCQDERPSFMAFQRFISNQIKGNASDIFTEIMLVICKKMKVNTRILYIDGTSMEANARSDTKTFIPFMDGYEKRYQEYPGIVVADAGYGSYDNYMYCLEKDIEGYLKYQNYRYEKTAKFKKDIYRKENLLREENGKLICPQGREFVYKQDYQNTKTDYPCITQVWECKTCNRCPLKKECTKAKTRAVRINPILDELKAHAKELLDSEAGIQLRQQRCIQAEGTFGIIKNDWQYNRIHRRGMENVENELYLICMGFNLMKYHQKKMRMILS
ncbi:MAG: transposase [Solobacterium sp.]|nr:transposase [Solobacterium sp.]